MEALRNRATGRANPSPVPRDSPHFRTEEERRTTVNTESEGPNGRGVPPTPVFTVVLCSCSVRKKIAAGGTCGQCSPGFKPVLPQFQGVKTQSGIFAFTPPSDRDTSPQSRIAALSRNKQTKA